MVGVVSASGKVDLQLNVRLENTPVVIGCTAQPKWLWISSILIICGAYYWTNHWAGFGIGLTYVGTLPYNWSCGKSCSAKTIGARLFRLNVLTVCLWFRCYPHHTIPMVLILASSLTLGSTLSPHLYHTKKKHPVFGPRARTYKKRKQRHCCCWQYD
jgi:hypothetical protein